MQEDMNYDVPDYEVTARANRWLGKPGESQYVPGWYDPHPNPDQAVKYRGEDQGMKIRNVMPHRRWAVDGNGEILSQAEFEALYIKYLSAMKFPETHMIANEAIPNVRTFVREKPDRITGHFVDFGFVDNGEVIKEQKFTQDGELAPEFLAKDKKSREDAGALKLLMQLLEDGLIPQREFTKRAKAIMGEAVEIGPEPEPEKKEPYWTPERRAAKAEEARQRNAEARARFEAQKAAEAAEAVE